MQMNLLILFVSFFAFYLSSATIKAATYMSSYPPDPSGHGLGFTRAHVDNLGRLLVFGNGSGPLPTTDSRGTAFEVMLD